MYRYLFLILAFFLICCDKITTESSHQEKIEPKKQESQMISEQQALEIAKNFLLEKNVLLDQYKFTISSAGNKWSVFFEGQEKYVAIGNHGWISIDKKTGETEYTPGR